METKFTVKMISKKIEEAANTHTGNKESFVSGAKWAIDNNMAIDGRKLTEDIVVLKDLYGKIFISGGQFTEQEAEVYENLVIKYEGLDLMKIF